MAFLEINLQNYTHNLKTIRQKLEADTRVCAVVKNNAYGMGLRQTARALGALDVDYFAVGTLQEAVTLRDSGIKHPILLLGIVDPYRQIQEVIDNDISLMLFDQDWAKAADFSARKWGKKLRYHLKIDTGMHRFGVYPREVADFLESISHLTGLAREGVFSHFASSTDEGVCSEQLTAFQEALFKLQTAGQEIGITHICSTNSIATLPEGHLDMVRVGMGLYGHSQTIENLKPVWQLKAKILSLKRVPQGASIGYSRTHNTTRSSVIAVADCGYTDGLPRIMSNQLNATIHGKTVKNVGMLCMNYSMFDVTGISAVKEGDELIIFGAEDMVQQLEQYQKVSQSTVYELIARFNDNLERVYINSDSK